MPRKLGKSELDPATRSYNEAVHILKVHPLFAPLISRAHMYRKESQLCPLDGWAVVSNLGYIYVHPTAAPRPKHGSTSSLIACYISR